MHHQSAEPDSEVRSPKQKILLITANGSGTRGVLPLYRSVFSIYPCFSGYP